MKTSQKLALLALFAGATIQPSQASETPVWYSYTGEYLPDDLNTNPIWSRPLEGVNTVASVGGGNLTIESTAVEGYLFFRQTGGEGQPWNPGALGSTIDLTLKVDSQLVPLGYAQSIGIFMGGYDALFTVSTSYIAHGNFGGEQALYELDTSVFHTYRVTATNTGFLSMYVDNSPTAVMAFQMAPGLGNYFEFGATTMFGGGTVQWQSIEWTNDGVFAPIPEPSSLLLSSLGIGSLLFFARRRYLTGSTLKG